ncbi:MAG: electron transfer flavoprotein subunit beta/FixA family protein [Gemmatimonadales bacterium]|nr:electron transfer flavoprotein subunit beta/FixA family protein [Gemmatimonadales bacterium]
MRLAVLLKRVPDTGTRLAIAPSRTSIDDTGVKFVANPYDEFALEAALQLKEAAGAGEVVVICLGPAAAQDVLRTALAMGADRAVLLQHDGPADAGQAAAALAAECAGADLVLAGKLAVDDYAGAVGPMVAERLGVGCLTALTRLTVAEGAATGEREVEGAVEVVRATLPAVVTCDKGLNTPRIPKLQGIMAAKKKPLDIRPAALPAAAVEVLALELAPERAGGRIVGDGAAAVPALVELLATEAKVL